MTAMFSHLLVCPHRQGKHKSPLLSPELLFWGCSLFPPPANANCPVLQSFLHWGHAQGKETLSALINTLQITEHLFIPYTETPRWHFCRYFLSFPGEHRASQVQSPRQNASGRNTAQHLPFISKQYLLYLLKGFAIPRLLEVSAILVKSIHTAGQNNLAVTPRVSKLERAFCALTVSDLIPSFFFFPFFFPTPSGVASRENEEISSSLRETHFPVFSQNPSTETKQMPRPMQERRKTHRVQHLGWHRVRQ